jgi:alginate O-acetyltransferase complex protein AlgI
MVFSSLTFLLYFFPIFLVVYFFAIKKLKNPVLLLSSILFYSWGAPKFILAILLTTTIDFYLVNFIHNANSEKHRKLFLVLSLVLNVGMLFYFKYCNFFIENFNSAFNSIGIKEITWTKIILPIGISFYTFESLTYAIDVYRRIHKPLNNFWQYQMYILLFPKLIAGPIIRYHEISDQIPDRSLNENAENRLSGFYRFVIGLAKKVLIANVMAAKADEVFNLPIDQINSSFAWIGILSYTFQIYFDFSGYSDMAIGIGKMIGFRFPENFDNPYTSKSITEFWRRWHMTLGNWMKNYLYIPLGGNKVNSKFRLYFNLWIVFIASGFWHGAAWTFIIWGVYHGLFLVLERLFLDKIYKRLGKILPMFITFVFICIGWVFFRAEKLGFAFEFIKKMFSWKWNMPQTFINTEYLFYLALALLFSFFVAIPFGKKLQIKIYFSQFSPIQHVFMTCLVICLYVFSVSSIAGTDYNPFIYFRF